MSLLTASYMNRKHYVRPEGVQNLLRFENTSNISLQTTDEKSTPAGVTSGRSYALLDSGFLNFRLSGDVCFYSLTFLDREKDRVLLITASHHTSPALVNHWENESRCWNLSRFHILLKDLFPTQTTSIPNTAASHGQQQVKCISCGQIHPCVSTLGYLPCCLSQTAPAHLSPLLSSRPLCAALGETRLCHSRSSYAAKPFWILDNGSLILPLH